MKDALLAAVKKGDVPGVRDLIVGATEKERRAAAPAFNDSSSRPYTSDVGAWRASGLARVGTATARQVSSEWWSLSPLRLEDDDDAFLQLAVDVIAARGPTFASIVARAIIDDAFSAIGRSCAAWWCPASSSVRKATPTRGRW